MNSKKKGKTIKQSNEAFKAGVTIIFVAVVVILVGLFSAQLWFSGVGRSTSKTISANSFDAAIDTSVDTKQAFDQTYYQTLQVLSEGFGHGTTWLPICENSQEIIDGEVYVEVCSDEYQSLDQIKRRLGQYLSSDYVTSLIGDSYREKDDKLYIKPQSVEKNEEYVAFDFYTVKQATQNRIIYMVTSSYQQASCIDDCTPYYEDHKLVLVKENNQWLVASMDMPF